MLTLYFNKSRSKRYALAAAVATRPGARLVGETYILELDSNQLMFAYEVKKTSKLTPCATCCSDS